MQYLEHEYNQIHKQMREKNQPIINGKSSLDQGSMKDYVEAAKALLCKKRAQLQIVRAEAASREQSKPCAEHDKVLQQGIPTEDRVKASNIAPSGS